MDNPTRPPEGAEGKRYLSRRRFLSLAALAATGAVSSSLLAACQQPAAQPTKAPAAAPTAAPTKAAAPGAGQPTSAPAAPKAVDKSNWPKRITFGGSAPGGTQSLWGAPVLQVINDKLGVSGTIEVTTGPSANIQLVDRKETDMGAVTVPIAWDAFHGEGAFKDTPYKNVRSMVPMYTAYLHWWALTKSGIKTIRDFNGKAINMSGSTSTPAVYGKLLFDFLEIKPSRIVNLASYDDAHSQLKDGRLDAVVTWAAIPHPAPTELGLTDDLTFIGVPKEDAERFFAKYPYVAMGQIPANTYKSLTQPLPTLTLWNVAVTHKDMPESFVYEATKAIFENRDQIISVYKAAAETALDNVPWITTPLHVGALRYYKEKGIKISDLAIPPEAK